MKDHLDLSQMNRRDFVKTTGLGLGTLAVPSFLSSQNKSAGTPAEKLKIAIIGVAGKGRGATLECVSENVVALCDVNKEQVDATKKGDVSFKEAIDHHESNGAVWFKDYRVMLKDMSDQIDAIIISIPDHMHFPVALSAINLGIHVYCEKPLTHTIDEARVLAAAAKKKGVRTQMGNQGHSLAGTCLVREWIQSGILGNVREVHSWTDRPAVYWKQGMGRPDHSKLMPVTPQGFDWELWLGVAKKRAYDPAYAPFRWRAYQDFGCGALGDMACHIMDSAYWALDLGYPTEIEATTTQMNDYTYPVSSVVTYQFPQRGKMVPLTYKWYDGDMRPPIPDFLKKDYPNLCHEQDNGSLIVGDGVAILTDTYSRTVKIIPNDKFMALRPKLPKKTLRRIKGSHISEFFNAIKEDRPATSDFSYSGPFTEMVLLGTIAQKLGRKLKFDDKKGAFINDAEANALIKKEYPNGWILS